MIRATFGIGGALRHCYANHVDVAAEGGATWRRLIEQMVLRYLRGGQVNPATFHAEWIDADANAARFPAWTCRSCGQSIRESAWSIEVTTNASPDVLVREAAKLAEVLHQDSIWLAVERDGRTVFDAPVTRALAPILA